MSSPDERSRRIATSITKPGRGQVNVRQTATVDKRRSDKPARHTSPYNRFYYVLKL